MTVEIAAINRVAVALATDSAVTVQRGHDAKVYQSENKLFELSKQKPVGIMIYNNMEYFGIPWEIIIKDFRSKHGHEPADHLFEWQDRFLTFVEDRFKPTSQMEVENLSQLISDLLMRILEEFDRQRIITWQKVGQDVSVASIEQTLLEQFQKIFDTEIEHLNADGETESILQHSVDRFLATNKEFLEREARRNFPRFPLTPVESDLLSRAAQALILSKRKSELFTGLVFAGYGDGELFPSLCSVEIDGSYDGCIKFDSVERFDVDRNSSDASVFAFAQDDLVNRVIYGADHRFENSVIDYFRSAGERLAAAINESDIGIDASEKERVSSIVRHVANDVIKGYWTGLSESLRASFYSEFADMVRAMPKQELIELAEYLVSITLLKQRLSTDQESVGGPIDVAIISRHDGFIWVRRKHYFDRILNESYFHRNFPSGRMEVSHGTSRNSGGTAT